MMCDVAGNCGISIKLVWVDVMVVPFGSLAVTPLLVGVILSCAMVGKKCPEQPKSKMAFLKGV